jgi:hypothetical protein
LEHFLSRERQLHTPMKNAGAARAKSALLKKSHHCCMDHSAVVVARFEVSVLAAMWAPGALLSGGVV